MNLEQIIHDLDLKVLTEPKDFSQMVPSGGYTSDLLSCVMAGAPHNGIWVINEFLHSQRSTQEGRQPL